MGANAAAAAMFGRDIELWLKGTEEEVRRQHAAFARQAKAEVVRQHHPSSVRTFVDGAEGRREDDVRAYGVIRYEFGYLVDVARAALALLEHLSPVDRRPDAEPPVFRESHQIFVDGQFWGLSGEGNELPRDLTVHDSIQIMNTLEYAVELERGLSRQAPAGVYEVAAEQLQAMYRHAAISFRYLHLGGPRRQNSRDPGVKYQLATGRISRRGRPGARPSYIHPVLTISLPP